MSDESTIDLPTTDSGPVRLQFAGFPPDWRIIDNSTYRRVGKVVIVNIDFEIPAVYVRSLPFPKEQANE